MKVELLGHRVANIYDLSEKCYLFKFAIAGKSEKITLLLESGIRFHTTKFVRDTPGTPSPFAMILRRHLRTKRLEHIAQLGVDRVVDFKFGSGEATCHIILELYANGNIVLTDGNFVVLALLRSHQFTEDTKLKVGEVYPIAYSTNLAAAPLGLGTSESSSTGDMAHTVGAQNSEGVTNKVPTSPAPAPASESGLAPAPGSVLGVTSGGQLSGQLSGGSGVLAMSTEQFLQWAEVKHAAFVEFTAHEELAYEAALQSKQAAQKQQMEQLQASAASASAAAADGVSSEKLKKQRKQEKQLQHSAGLLVQASMPRKKKTKEMTLKQLLLSKDSGVASHGPEILDHCLLQAGIKPSMKVQQLGELKAEELEGMLEKLRTAEGIAHQLNSSGSQTGYIIVASKPTPSATTTNAIADAASSAVVTVTVPVTAPEPEPEYMEYIPMLFAQHSGRELLSFPSFAAAVDQYYRRIEAQRLEKEANAVEAAAQKKVDKIQRDQDRIRAALAAQQARTEQSAALLEMYAEDVDKAALVLNSAVGAGMAWEDVAEMVKSETAAGTLLSGSCSAYSANVVVATCCVQKKNKFSFDVLCFVIVYLIMQVIRSQVWW
jgi:hypothetical protein